MYAANQQSMLQGGRYPEPPRPIGPEAIEKPRIMAMIDQLEKMLSVCHDHANSIENSADRIIGPAPAEAAGPAPTPPSVTVEQRLSQVMTSAEHLSYRLGNAAQRLNSAV